MVRIESLLVIRLPEIMLLISIIAAGALRTEALEYLKISHQSLNCLSISSDSLMGSSKLLTCDS